MEFKLVYKGEMKTHPKHRKHYIHDIRLLFHEQLKNLMKIPPFSELKKFINPDDAKFFEMHGRRPKNIVKKINGVEFVPIISPEMDLLAEIDIEILHPELLGTARADIDNRLKTLLDTLKRPQNPMEIPREQAKGARIYTLLDDDKMITKLNVNTSHLLIEDVAPDEIFMLINIKVVASKGTFDNIHLVV